MGLGKNGHIAFNEPGCDWDLEFFDTPLSNITKNNLKNLSISITHGRTLGIKNILSAKKILLLISGKKKVDKNFPVTSLINHPNLTIIIQK